MNTAIPRTMVHQLHAQAERLKDRPALWSKRNGSWQPTSWRQYAQRVKDFALGLSSLGFGPKQAMVVMGFNREEWVVADLAAMACGGMAVGLYTTSSPEQVAYIAGHCEAPIALVENAEYLERLSSVRGQLPALKHVIVMEPQSRRGGGVLTYTEVLERGSKEDDAEYYARLERLDPKDVAQLIYTSGTTGNPKGVMLTHRNIAWTAVHLSMCHPTDESDVVLSYLPLSHIAEQVCTIYGPVLNGIQVYFAESFEKLPENLREVRPTAFFGVPRVWEKFMAKAQAGLESQPRARRRIVAWARGAASRYHSEVMAHRQPSLALAAQYALAQRLVFQKLKARIGFDRTHIFATSAAPIAKEVLEFFASLDIVIAEVYGQSEVTGPTSVNVKGAMKLGTLGRPMPGVEVRIADDGEILVRGDNVCAGYFKDEAATRELLQDGWLHSGDVGYLDEEGFLKITGRKKEIIVTSGGKKTSPANIEGMLKAIEPLGNALVIGEARNYLTAILAIDPEKVGPFAQKHGFPADPNALAQSSAFRAYLERRIETEVNPRLARFETVKKFEVLPHDFTVEGGELTSTLKVRRKVCEQKYADLIAKLYA
jgi:long-chain acyl-CoA synthetase